MQTVYLNGELAKFGEKWETSCSTIPEILRLIECQTEGFRKHLMEAAEAGLEYTIQRGKDFIDEEELLLSIGEEDIIITEVPAGSKGGGLKTVIGVALLVTALVLSGGGFGATFGSFAKFESFYASDLKRFETEFCLHMSETPFLNDEYFMISSSCKKMI